MLNVFSICTLPDSETDHRRKENWAIGVEPRSILYSYGRCEFVLFVKFLILKGYKYVNQFEAPTLIDIQIEWLNSAYRNAIGKSQSSQSNTFCI